MVLGLLALVVVLIVAGYALYLANMAGRLPWQEEPTRIPVTPFADLGGAGDDADADATEPAPGTPVTDASPWLIGSLAVVAPLPAG